jgi:UDP-N-acetylglucosamine diphosphorylase / glucose-1-phosphate thymidylyltransferase / UDP-N-acetylgalactosamine diphosphorylase / glucosamine-1-phosphate N-acetyltransferase / galactosamine-1-phosphate N-acetyltransferase
MDLICLAAGAGTRLGRLGGYLQKCMYPVGLRPFLEHALLQVLAADAVEPGRDRLALVVGHLGAQVRGHFGASFEGLEIVYAEQGERLGTGHALTVGAAALRPRGPVLVWQADLFPTAAMIDAVARHPAPNVVTLAPGHENEPDELRATVDGDAVLRVWEGDGELFDVGLWKLAPAVLGRMTELRSDRGEYRVLPNLQRCLDDGARIGHVVAPAWIHLGGVLPTPEANVRAVVRRVWAATDALRPTVLPVVEGPSGGPEFDGADAPSNSQASSSGRRP